MVRNSSKDAPEDNNPKTEWSRLDPLLDQVLAVDDAEQQRAIALKITEGDPDLRAELLQLVEGIGASEGFLTREPAAVWPDLIADLDGGAAPLPTGPDRAGEQLGVYRLEEQIGRGGMGEVYLAHRTDGAFERRVAVKIARPQPGLATPVERFRAEQHILADLDHPHIAGLLDAGLTDDGSPFAVMEYVKGRPIDEHCRGLSIDERLRLFVDVCEAVDHAHRRLVIHRDLKPSNILVDGDGRVKLLDFGIAKLLDPQGGASHDAGTLYLTPEYAAPEQFMRGRLSVATDVFALGAILFELLTGDSLRQFEGSSPPVWIERVLKEKTPKPSAGAKDPKLRRRLQGDLDAIVDRALEGDPELRYASASALAHDIVRHLESRPVEARRGQRLYRAGRLLRRHWLSFGLGLLIAAALLTAATTAMHESRQADAQRQRALASAERAERVSTFLVDLFGRFEPVRFRHDEVSARDLLDLGAERARQELGDTPGDRSELLLTLGVVYWRMGLFEESLEQLELLPKPEQLRPIPADGAMPPGVPTFQVSARILRLHGHLERTRGDEALAAELYAAALAHSRRHLEIDGPSSGALAHVPNIQLDLGNVYRGLGRFPESTAEIESVLEQARDRRDLDLEAAALAGLAASRNGDGSYDADLLRQAIAIYRSPEVDDPRSLLATLNNLGILLTDTGDWDEAGQVLEEGLEQTREAFGPGHERVATGQINLARLRIDQGRFRDSLDLLKQAEGILEQLGVEPANRYLLALRMSRGRALAELGDPAARESLEKTRRHFLAHFAPDHPWTPMIELRIAQAKLRLSDYRGALAEATSALNRLPEGHPLHREAAFARAASQRSLGDVSAATCEVLEATVEDLGDKLPPHAWPLASARVEATQCRRDLGEDVRLPAGVVDALTASRGADDALTQRARALAASP